MKRITLNNESDQYFEQAWKVYEHSFPELIRRPRPDQLKLMQHPLYFCDVLIDEQDFYGFIFWWDFKNFRYVEYFAIGSEQRNSGRGKGALVDFIGETEKPIILEVELPHEKIDQRRIRFYERIGFKLIDYKYVLQPMRDGDPALEFLLMSYPYVFSNEEVADFIDNCHPIIFGIDQ